MARKGKAKTIPKKRKADLDDSEVEANNLDFLLTDPQSALVNTNLAVGASCRVAIFMAKCE